jgi:hypothetical protein
LPDTPWLACHQEERAMWDLWIILITAITFALAFGLVRWFDQI